jgi:hypothetical protein
MSVLCVQLHNAAALHALIQDIITCSPQSPCPKLSWSGQAQGYEQRTRAKAWCWGSGCAGSGNDIHQCTSLLGAVTAVLTRMVADQAPMLSTKPEGSAVAAQLHKEQLDDTLSKLYAFAGPEEVVRHAQALCGAVANQCKVCSCLYVLLALCDMQPVYGFGPELIPPISCIHATLDVFPTKLPCITWS